MSDMAIGTREGAPVELAPLPARPLVSLLVANYNYAGYIGMALDSALSQSYDNLEVCICDDGSSDDSIAVIEGYAERDGRIKLTTKANGGAASALNVAFEMSRGEIVCLLDADDIFEPNKLATVVAAFREQNCGLLVHPLLVIDGDGAAIQRKPSFGHLESGWIADRVAARGGRWAYMEASAVCLRREVAELLFPIPEDLFRTWADAYLCSLGALLTPVGNVDEALARYRIHTSNVSGFNTLTPEHGAKAMNGFDRLTEGVNRGLQRLHPEMPPLKATDNLTYLESRLQKELLEGGTPPSRSARTFFEYARRVAGDDIYGTARKALSIFFFGTALFLPLSVRPRWLSAGLTHSRTKENARKLAARVRGGLRRRNA